MHDCKHTDLSESASSYRLLAHDINKRITQYYEDHQITFEGTNSASNTLISIIDKSIKLAHMNDTLNTVLVSRMLTKDFDISDSYNWIQHYKIITGLVKDNEVIDISALLGSQKVSLDLQEASLDLQEASKHQTTERTIERNIKINHLVIRDKQISKEIKQYNTLLSNCSVQINCTKSLANHFKNLISFSQYKAVEDLKRENGITQVINKNDYKTIASIILNRGTLTALVKPVEVCSHYYQTNHHLRIQMNYCFHFIGVMPILVAESLGDIVNQLRTINKPFYKRKRNIVYQEFHINTSITDDVDKQMVLSESIEAILLEKIASSITIGSNELIMRCANKDAVGNIINLLKKCKTTNKQYPNYKDKPLRIVVKQLDRASVKINAISSKLVLIDMIVPVGHSSCTAPYDISTDKNVQKLTRDLEDKFSTLRSGSYILNHRSINQGQAVKQPYYNPTMSSDTHLQKAIHAISYQSNTIHNIIINELNSTRRQILTELITLSQPEQKRLLTLKYNQIPNSKQEEDFYKLALILRDREQLEEISHEMIREQAKYVYQDTATQLMSETEAII